MLRSMNGGQVCGAMVQAFQTNGSKAGHFLPFSPASLLSLPVQPGRIPHPIPCGAIPVLSSVSLLN